MNLYSHVNALFFLAQVSSIVPEFFLSGGTLRVCDLIDRKEGQSIGIKRMKGLGKTGYPENFPTHMYISFQHFFELNEFLNHMMETETEYPGTTKKYIKFVQALCVVDMYQRESVHEGPSSTCCNRCRSYVNSLNHKSIWWFELGVDRFVRMAFKNVSKENTSSNCCIWSIKIAGLFEVELNVESASEGHILRRSFRVVRNALY